MKGNVEKAWFPRKKKHLLTFRRRVFHIELLAYPTWVSIPVGKWLKTTFITYNINHIIITHNPYIWGYSILITGLTGGII
jgi:hypothetical protein